MASLDIAELRKVSLSIVCLGSHPGIIQSILDFDYLQGREKPSVSAIVASGRKSERYFYGKKEVIIPVYGSLSTVPDSTKQAINLSICLVSGRRVAGAVSEAVQLLPALQGVTIFAERVPEKHALELHALSAEKNVWIIGASSVGLIIAGQLKLGAIGGIEAVQIQQSNLLTPGRIAVVSSSGGMVNEIIRMVANAGYGISFALAIGGEKFPVFTPRDAFLSAQNDAATEAIAYFGELGGQDEYELVELLTSKQVTKPVVAYIAGTVAELFDTPPQFGHAKAMASSSRESASAKRQALQDAGALVASSFTNYVEIISGLQIAKQAAGTVETASLEDRKPALISSSVSYDEGGEVKVVGQDLLELAGKTSFAGIVGRLFLGKPTISTETEQFIDFVLRLLVDHGPYVSGAVNTIVTARAGRDLVSSLSAGLLTVGPRFGGAINGAAEVWLKGVSENIPAGQLVEDYASKKQYIPGIGHRKYRSDNPDPRVKQLLALTEALSERKFTKFALQIESETIQKKGNLILNVDGTIAASLLDLLREKEGYDDAQLRSLIDVEFFNALFVLSRSVGFMAHYFDQKRLDEGLFRLGEDDVMHVPIAST